LLALVILLALLATLFVGGCAQCCRAETVLAADSQGSRIVVVRSVCTGIGTMIWEDLQLVRADGSRTTFFSYVPLLDVRFDRGLPDVTGGEPSVTWDSDGVHVAIGALRRVADMHDVVDGIQVSYEIGAVLDRKPVRHARNTRAAAICW
jgi:hypothetical protein